MSRLRRLRFLLGWPVEPVSWNYFTRSDPGDGIPDAVELGAMAAMHARESLAAQADRNDRIRASLRRVALPREKGARI